MSRQLECEIVEDLLPSYVDGQTSQITNAAIEEHISSCQECAASLSHMKEPDNVANCQTEEIDYLKKVKKSKSITTRITAAITLASGLIVAGLLVFVRGAASNLNMHAVNIQVEGNMVCVVGELVSSGEGLPRLKFAENDGVVDVKLFTAPIAPFNRAAFKKHYIAKSDTIKAVTSGGVVVWENGLRISDTAGKLYAAKNPYIGNMSANQRVAEIIGIGKRYGAYTNELQTSNEPYGWVIILEKPISLSQETIKRQRMFSDACLMIAGIGNLNNVTWRYENGAGRQEYTITEQEASEFVGANIKRLAESASGIEEIVKAVS